jgi:hypothetical protein
MSDKAAADGLAVHPRRSARTLKMNFTEPITFGFFWFFQRPNGPRPWSGRSAPAHQRLKSQRSAVTAISTAIEHLMRRRISDKAATDGPAVHPGRSAGR